MYHEVYDQHGTMFEVTASRAKALLNSGWTVSYPEDLSNVFKAPSRIATSNDATAALVRVALVNLLRLKKS